MDIQKITGTISLRPVKAELVHDPRTNSITLGPYCLLFVGCHRLKTKPSNGPLQQPVWNDSFIVNITNEDVIHVKICATSLAFKTQNLLGQGSLEISKLKCDSEVHTHWINIFSTKGYIGKLQLETRYIDAPKGQPKISCLHPEYDEVIQKKVPSLVFEDLPPEQTNYFMPKPKHHSMLSLDLYDESL